MRVCVCVCYRTRQREEGSEVSGYDMGEVMLGVGGNR